MPRPIEFVREDALAAAMEVFWCRGYEASSINMIIAAMGINRGTLYSSFGDKEKLFLLAMDAYEKQKKQLFDSVLIGIENPLDAIRRFMTIIFLEADDSELSKGCLVCNTIELQFTQPHLAEYASERIGAFEQAVISRLLEAQSKQLVPKEKDVQVLASLIVNTFLGLRLYCKAGLEKEKREAIIDSTLAALQ